MNSNLFHNIVNVAMVVMSGVTAFLISTGCVETAGRLVCDDHAFLSPELSATIVGVLGVAKIVVNVARDGLAGLAKKQPPVE